MAVKPAMHGRDHCPGGSDPIPAACLSSAGNMAWIRRGRGIGSTILPIGAGSTSITFDSTVGSDDRTTYFDTPASHQIELLSDMIAVVSWTWSWNENFAQQTNFYINDGLQNDEEFTGFHNTGEANTQSGCFMQHWESGTVLSFEMAQLSGSTKNIDWGFVMVTRLSGYSGPDPSTLDPDE